MTLLNLVHISDPRLRKATETIHEFNADLHRLVDNMIETMYHENGIGLAAPQVGISLKLAVIDVSASHSEPFCIINPEIISKSGEVMLEEGCLSVPGAYDSAPRALDVLVKAQDRNGAWFEIKADGILAHCLQHEIDHLNGKVFIDYLSPLKRQVAKQKSEKHLRRLQKR